MLVQEKFQIVRLMIELVVDSVEPITSQSCSLTRWWSLR